jgi:CheY-like chemotaxis protein
MGEEGMAKKILLADDSITIQKVIELTFSDEDFDVITVGNGRLALERLPEVRPDIVLCDIMMPEKDGYEVCEQIKSNPAWSHVPVLLLTGAFEPFDQERAARAGYDGSLAKPFEPETLIAKVKDLMARAPGRPAAPPSAVAAPPVPTVLPFARASAATPPPVVVGAPAAPLGTGFISDEEPLAESEAREAETSAPASRIPSAPPSPPPTPVPLASLSKEESASLASPAGASAEDAASTVMFRSSDLPWSAPEASAPAPASPPSPPRREPPSPAAAPAAARVVLPEPSGEPVLRPDAAAPLGAPATGETPVYEAVLDEDLDFGPAGFEPEPATEDAGGETLFAPEAAPAPDRPPTPLVEAPASTPVPEAASSLDDLVSSVPAEPAPPEAEPSFVEESLVHEEPAPAPRPTPSASDGPVPRVRPEAASSAAPLAREDSREPEPGPAAPEPARGPAPEPIEPETPPAASPLADLGSPPEEVPATPASQAAALSVPVDMVEKIAQRVVAQVSEKVVREIAWEVIPDLAEALIKQEIERLKAELQKT